MRTESGAKIREMKWPLSATVLILLASYAFTAYAFMTPNGLKHFNYVMFIPGPIAALFLLLQTRKPRELLRPMLSKVPFRVLAFSVLYPVVFILVCALLSQLFGWASIDWQKLPSAIHGSSVSQFFWAVAFVFGEEYAWRGYLLPQFARSLGPVKSAALVGIVWAIWHGPLVYGLASHMNTTTQPVLLTLVQMTVVFLFSFPFSYAYFKSRSIVPTMTIHYVWNWLNPDILGNIYRNTPGLAQGNIFLINGEGVLGAVLGLVFAAWYIKNPDQGGLRDKVLPKSR